MCTEYAANVRIYQITLGSLQSLDLARGPQALDVPDDGVAKSTERMPGAPPLLRPKRPASRPLAAASPA